MPGRTLLARRRTAGLLALALLLALPRLVPYTALATEMLVFALFAAAYDLVLGYSGLLSFGHAAFFGLGAYGTGILLLRVVPSVPLALAAGLLLAALAGLVIGALCMRRAGVYFAMVTLAFGQMLYFVAFKWNALTGGDDGLQGVPRPPLGPLSLRNEAVLYYVVLAVVIASVLFLSRVVNSPFGKTLEALRENPARARSIGYDVGRYRLAAFVMSATFSGLAGGLYALLLNFVPVSTLYWPTSGEVVMMSIIGGTGTLFGPMAGAMFVVLLRDIVNTYTRLWGLAMGAVFMVAVLAFRQGIAGPVWRRLKD